ncbi:MAG: recombinase family protein [Candidatus Competibacteraceae bacterium]
MLIGYARVSTDAQSLALQLDALEQACCQRVFTDKASGTNSNRPGLTEALSHLREGDVLVIWKLDRLGRTVKGLVDFVGELADRGVQFRSLTDGIDTATPTGRFFFHVMASLAQMERELLVERTKAGLEAARQRGRLVGRQRRMTPSKIEAVKKLLASGVSPREVAQNLGVSVPTLYRWIPASTR